MPWFGSRVMRDPRISAGDQITGRYGVSMLGRSATLEPISDGNQHCTGSKGGSARHRGKKSNVTQFAQRSMSEASIKYFRKKPRHSFVIKAEIGRAHVLNSSHG